jgi:lipopolysaccharide transport system ATP-binding protein
MSSDIAIKVENLSKCYQIYDTPRDRLKQFVLPRMRAFAGKGPKQYFREFWALKDVSFEMKKGDTVGIIGRNGSGKSTLLQMICGTLTPTSGSIQTHGRIAALLELGSAFNPEFTGRENAYMNASVLGLSNEEIDARFDDIAAFADIGDFIEQPVKTYSSGMTVRLAFAVIAHVDADILVVDEALAVGDAFFSQKCMRFLRNFLKTGTLLFVSHDTGAVLNLCQIAIWLNKGVVQALGTAKEVTERYLEKLCEAQQGESIPQQGAIAATSQEVSKPLQDMRLDFINQTNLRNDIELFSFSPEKPNFGKGGAKISDVNLLDNAGNRLSWIVGGKSVRLVVDCTAQQRIVSPIVGFMVKDRLGQVIFGDNTYLVYAHRPIELVAGEHFRATFHFVMPIMPLGDYAVSAQVAEGSQIKHVQHQWYHEALVFKVHATSVCHGLIGVPMERIELVKIS